MKRIFYSGLFCRACDRLFFTTRCGARAKGCGHVEWRPLAIYLPEGLALRSSCRSQPN